ncbi:hypothetical protein V1478_017084 [Vespula squamosa]|uniref:Uncharacterized protein n=1 Tax=Vespula squamosa TaxID=30214 RepID=A0ABD1ZYE0_VESSQ
MHMLFVFGYADLIALSSLYSRELINNRDKGQPESVLGYRETLVRDGILSVLRWGLLKKNGNWKPMVEYRIASFPSNARAYALYSAYACTCRDFTLDDFDKWRLQSEPPNRQAAMLLTKQCFPNIVMFFYRHHHHHHHHHYDHHHYHHRRRTRIGVGAVQSQVRSVHIELQPWRRQQVLGTDVIIAN